MKRIEDIPNIKENHLGSRPSWDEYFMHLAIGISSRTSCYHVRAGSVLVDKNNVIIGTGYNGAPKSIESCTSRGICVKNQKGLDYEESLNTGTCIGVHAEMNAIGHMTKNPEGKIRLYTTVFPCHTCAKNILPYGIEEVIFKGVYSSKEDKNTLELFGEANIKLQKLNLSLKRYIDISTIKLNEEGFKFGIFTDEEINESKKFVENI
jgi:dCMP deaminase